MHGCGSAYERNREMCGIQSLIATLLFKAQAHKKVSVISTIVTVNNISMGGNWMWATYNIDSAFQHIITCTYMYTIPEGIMRRHIINITLVCKTSHINFVSGIHTSVSLDCICISGVHISKSLKCVP